MKILVWTTIRLFSKGGFPGVLAAESPPAGFLATEPPGKSWLLISLSSARTLHLFSKGSFSGGSANKEPACNTGDSSLIPGLGRSPGKGNGYPLQHSGLESSMGSTVHGVAKGRTWLSDFHFYPASLAMPSSITHTRLAPLLTQWLSHTLQLLISWPHRSSMIYTSGFWNNWNFLPLPCEIFKISKTHTAQIFPKG